MEGLDTNSYLVGLRYKGYKILVHSDTWEIPDNLKDAHRQGVEKCLPMAWV